MSIAESATAPSGARTKRGYDWLNLEVLVCLGPIVALALVFILMPLLIILYFSFLKSGLYGTIIRTFTLENFADVFQGDYGIILVRSLGYAALTNLLCILLGYPLAYYIARYGGRWKTFLVFMVVVPSWTAYLIRIYALKTIMNTKGLLNYLLLKLHLISAPLDILYTPFAVTLGLVYTWLPFMVLPLHACLEGLDPAVLEAALDLGANPMRRFFRVTLPLTKGGLLAGSILVFIPTLGDWLVPYLLGGSKVMMVGTLVAHKFTVAADIPGGCSLAVMLAAVLLLSLYLVIKLGGEETLERLV